LTSRSGHIRSAINIPGLDVFDSSNDDRHLKSIDQLRALYANIDPSKSVVTYCNDGVRASATYFVLRRLGYNVANYDGAWLEWGNDTSLPIDAPALGAAQGEGM
jgi:thiosulfate/3-mercaptopyruvate sulfurtransferase